MGILSALQPEAVFRYFEQICAIPHGSGNGQAIGAFCADFAKRHGLRHLRDAYGNVVIWKDGRRDTPPVILQGHLDMVCVHTPDVTIDFLHDALPLATDGVSVYCEGTSLGADDGIAVAMILALLESNDPAFPPIEAVLTMDEETGMFGAAGLDVSCLAGRRMLNLDSEAEGVFWVSCAGGERVTASLNVRRDAQPADSVRIRLTGLLGGHSGTEIDKGRQNAVRCMARLLLQSGARLVSMSGGKVDNAIPSACEAVACVSASAVREAFDALSAQWRRTDPLITLDVCASPDAQPLTAQDSDTVLRLIEALPCGVQAWSRDIENLVETSLNLGVCTVEGSEAALHYSVRSGVDAQRSALVRQMRTVAASFGADIRTDSGYPAWQYRKDSPLRETAARVYRAHSGRAPQIQAIHAGLECGIFCGKIPNLDCISLGPDITDIHSPQERLNVASAARTYALVTDILRAL